MHIHQLPRQQGGLQHQRLHGCQSLQSAILLEDSLVASNEEPGAPVAKGNSTKAVAATEEAAKAVPAADEADEPRIETLVKVIGVMSSMQAALIRVDVIHDTVHRHARDQVLPKLSSVVRIFVCP